MLSAGLRNWYLDPGEGGGLGLGAMDGLGASGIQMWASKNCLGKDWGLISLFRSLKFFLCLFEP